MSDQGKSGQTGGVLRRVWLGLKRALLVVLTPILMLFVALGIGVSPGAEPAPLDTGQPQPMLVRPSSVAARREDALSPQLRVDDVAQRALSLIRIGRQRIPGALPHLFAALADPHPDVRACAAWALGEVGDADAAPALAPAVEDGEWLVRAHALLALARIGGNVDTDALARALREGYALQAQWESLPDRLEAVANLCELLHKLDEELKGRRRRAEDAGPQPDLRPEPPPIAGDTGGPRL